MSAGRVVAIGECMVELAPAGDGLLRMGYAGDTLNTAWYARAALPDAWRVAYHTVVGTDELSRGMVAFIAANGIGTATIGRHPTRRCGLYAITLDAGERSFTYWRGESAARALAQDRGTLTAAVQGASLVYLTGITLAILPPEGRRTLLGVLAEARAAGARVAFDPNIRPALWESGEALRAAVSRAAAGADIVLPGFDDEHAAFGDADPAATAARYRALGAEEVVVKTGGGPIRLETPAGACTVADLRRVAACDTTGAGDSFNGAYLAARLCGADPVAAVHRAHVLASQVICHTGALMPMLDAMAACAAARA